MRTSVFLTALITAPVLAVVGCSAHSTPKPVKGTVSEKEYKAAKSCPKTHTIGKEREKSTVKSCTPHKECYELDITVDKTGEEIEVCDRAAFNALGEGDPYSSAINYATVNR